MHSSRIRYLAALATSAPGQSGQPGSPHYADLALLRAKGAYFPLAYSRPKVGAVTRHRLTLRPRRRPASREYFFGVLALESEPVDPRL